jgi:hypothetical protein
MTLITAAKVRRDAYECPLSPDEHNDAILCLRANLACGQGGARIEKEEEEETEVTKLLNNIL